MAPAKSDSSSLSPSPSASAAPSPSSFSVADLAQSSPSINNEPTPTTQQEPSQTSAASSKGLPVAARAALAIGGILIGLILLFFLTVFVLKRQYRARQKVYAATASRGVYEATSLHDNEDTSVTRPSEDIERKQSIDSYADSRYGDTRARSGSRASKRPSHDDYLKTSRRISSIGSSYAPGIELEEAYNLYGQSTTSLVRTDDNVSEMSRRSRGYSETGTLEESQPLNSHQRRASEASALSRSGSRPLSLLDNDSRYPSMSGHSRRTSSHSFSLSSRTDPFSDSTPVGSPDPMRKSFIEGPPPGAAKPITPGSSTTPPEGRRVSVHSGIGVNTKPAEGPSSSSS
ncbi:hypothetical protein FRB99_001751 [Tulasnella sp. 403]|nr:hypothetical protein FRB99_001751 [Tulasnella sp. 403]